MLIGGYDNFTNEYFIQFSNTNHFDEALATVKENRLIYNPSNKRWIGTPLKIINTCLQLEDFEQIQRVGWSDVEANKNFTSTIATKFKRKRLDNDCVLSEPILGKSPYEDFQIKAIQKGIGQNRYCFFLGMGSGKSFITISTLNHYFKEGSIDKVLIVTPPEGVYNWLEELKMFSTFANTEDKVYISTASHNRDPFKEIRKETVIIMSYRHYLTISDDYYFQKTKKKSKSYKKPVIPFNIWGDNRAIILDESHKIKNSKSRQTKVISLHKNYFEYRYLLTGTPTPNTFEEIYAQIKFLDDGILPSYWDWLEDTASLGNRFSKYAINYFYPDRVSHWEEILKRWVTRYTSDQILDLPELVIVDTYAEMTAIQKEIYQHLINYVVGIIKETEGRLVPKLLKNKFSYISLAYENAELLKGKIDELRSPKLAKLVKKFNLNKHHGKMEIVQSLATKYIDEEGLKLTISDFHPSTLDHLAEVFKKYNPIVIHGQNVPTGEDKVKYRNTQLETFKTDKNCKLLLASSTVLNTAVNITECTRVINFSRSFSYTNYSQFIKRFHRIKQTNHVIIHNMIFRDSLDISLDKTLKKKQDLDSSIFNEDSLTKETWKSIFKGEAIDV